MGVVSLFLSEEKKKRVAGVKSTRIDPSGDAINKRNRRPLKKLRNSDNKHKATMPSGKKDAYPGPKGEERPHQTAKRKVTRHEKAKNSIRNERSCKIVKKKPTRGTKPRRIGEQSQNGETGF